MNEDIISSEEFEEESQTAVLENGDNITEGEPEPESAEKGEEKYFKTFETKEEYQNNIDRIFNSRFRDYKETKTKYENIVDELKNYFDTTDDAAALSMFSEHMSRQNAEKKGISVQDYKKYALLEKKAGKYDELMQQQAAAEAERLAKESRSNAIRSRLFSEADIIKKTDKSFNLQKLYDSDDDFKKDLEESGSVFLAYTRMKSRLGKHGSFRESGSSDMAAGHVSATAADLSDSEFEKYINKIQGNL